MEEKYIQWQNAGRLEKIPPCITVFGVSELGYKSDPDEYDGTMAAVEQHRIAMNRAYKECQRYDESFTPPEIEIQWVKELDEEDLLLTGLKEGKVKKFGSAIIVLHGWGEMISKSDDASPSNFVHCTKLLEKVDWDIFTITLATCQAKFQKEVLECSSRIFQVIGDHENDIKRNDGGMAEVLRIDTFNFCRDWKKVLKSARAVKNWLDYKGSTLSSTS